MSNPIRLKWSHKRLTAFLAVSKMRVASLARASGLPYPSVRDYVLGTYVPNVDAALSLAAALGVGLPELCEPVPALATEA